jgi:hypothetical protein
MDEVFTSWKPSRVMFTISHSTDMRDLCDHVCNNWVYLIDGVFPRCLLTSYFEILTQFRFFLHPILTFPLDLELSRTPRLRYKEIIFSFISVTKKSIIPVYNILWHQSFVKYWLINKLAVQTQSTQLTLSCKSLFVICNIFS